MKILIVNLIFTGVFMANLFAENETSETIQQVLKNQILLAPDTHFTPLQSQVLAPSELQKFKSRMSANFFSQISEKSVALLSEEEKKKELVTYLRKSGVPQSKLKKLTNKSYKMIEKEGLMFSYLATFDKSPDFSLIVNQLHECESNVVTIQNRMIAIRDEEFPDEKLLMPSPVIMITNPYGQSYPLTSGLLSNLQKSNLDQGCTLLKIKDLLSKEYGEEASVIDALLNGGELEDAWDDIFITPRHLSMQNAIDEFAGLHKVFKKFQTCGSFIDSAKEKFGDELLIEDSYQFANASKLNQLVQVCQDVNFEDINANQFSTSLSFYLKKVNQFFSAYAEDRLLHPFTTFDYSKAQTHSRKGGCGAAASGIAINSEPNKERAKQMADEFMNKHWATVEKETSPMPSDNEETRAYKEVKRNAIREVMTNPPSQSPKYLQASAILGTINQNLNNISQFNKASAKSARYDQKAVKTYKNFKSPKTKNAIAKDYKNEAYVQGLKVSNTMAKNVSTMLRPDKNGKIDYNRAFETIPRRPNDTAQLRDYRREAVNHSNNPIERDRYYQNKVLNHRISNVDSAMKATNDKDKISKLSKIRNDLEKAKHDLKTQTPQIAANVGQDESSTDIADHIQSFSPDNISSASSGPIRNIASASTGTASAPNVTSVNSQNNIKTLQETNGKDTDLDIAKLEELDKDKDEASEIAKNEGENVEDVEAEQEEVIAKEEVKEGNNEESPLDIAKEALKSEVLTIAKLKDEIGNAIKERKTYILVDYLNTQTKINFRQSNSRLVFLVDEGGHPDVVSMLRKL